MADPNYPSWREINLPPKIRTPSSETVSPTQTGQKHTYKNSLFNASICGAVAMVALRAAHT